jgi:anti-sigma B factor antagonist
MTFSVAKQGETVVIDIEGHLVVGNRQALKQLVLDELGRGERHFRIDFRRTRYVDSSGLGVLVAMSKKVAQDGGVLSLANLDEDLRTLFVLTKLDTLFRFEDPPVDLPSVIPGFTASPLTPTRAASGRPDTAPRGEPPPP